MYHQLKRQLTAPAGSKNLSIATQAGTRPIPGTIAD
jgi:hypothetical protein